ERVARSIDVPVITVSEAMATIAVYRNNQKHTTQSSGWLIDRSSQALATLQRFRQRFDDALAALTRLEMEDTVSVRDVVNVLQPGEMVRRIAEEIDGHLVELGSDGRLIRLQTEELRAGVSETLGLVLSDYADGELSSSRLRALPPDSLMDLIHVMGVLGLPVSGDGMHAEMAARGFRLLYRLPQLSPVLIDRLVARFGALPEIMSASTAELESIEGIGAATARAVREGLARMVEASIFERYE
ncbi:MAG TPA: DNA integrity scanning diadenylate cyclase DisA, partial [Acidimicrobiales bacterium]|nr:DNA integrity scanning diadenylate cyclase DisA [Acidimicrobiales bacterium]